MVSGAVAGAAVEHGLGPDGGGAHATKKETRKGYHYTAKGTKTAAHTTTKDSKKAAHKTKKGVKKIFGHM